MHAQDSGPHGRPNDVGVAPVTREGTGTGLTPATGAAEVGPLTVRVAR
ncbi:hypothetical protein [Streptomyces sp. NPDC000410]